MTSDTFNQLFNEYRQQVVETSVAAVQASSPDSTPSWLTILQRHVQEWKQHYSLESKAIQQVKGKYMRRYLSGPSGQTTLLANEDQEIMEVTKSFQAKRESIWIRQQQELSRLGIMLS